MEILLFGLSRRDWGCHSDTKLLLQFLFLGLRLFFFDCCCCCCYSADGLTVLYDLHNTTSKRGREEDTVEQNTVIDKCRNSGGHYGHYSREDPVAF